MCGSTRRAPLDSGTLAPGDTRRSPASPEVARPPVPRATGEALVELRPRLLRHALVRRVPDQEVSEPERVLVGEGSRVPGGSALADERHRSTRRDRSLPRRHELRDALRSNTWPSTAARSSDARSSGPGGPAARQERRTVGGTGPGEVGDAVQWPSSRWRRPSSTSIANISSTNSGLPSAAAGDPPRTAMRSSPPARSAAQDGSHLRTAERREQDRGASACRLPRPAASRRSGLARQRRSIGASRAHSATWSTRSRKVSSPQWMSSKTRTSGSVARGLEEIDARPRSSPRRCVRHRRGRSPRATRARCGRARSARLRTRRELGAHGVLRRVVLGDRRPTRRTASPPASR